MRLAATLAVAVAIAVPVQQPLVETCKTEQQRAPTGKQRAACKRKVSATKLLLVSDLAAPTMQMHVHAGGGVCCWPQRSLVSTT